MPLILGSIAFSDMEVPSEINFSGAYSAAKHQLIGGGRVIDMMGDNPDPIEWTGTFIGPDAAPRARAVDALKQSGQSVTLSWPGFSYTVVVKEFKPKYHFASRVEYHISCEVVVSGTAVSPTLDSLVQGDLGALASFPGLPATAVAAITAVQSAVAAVAVGAATGQLADLPLAGLLPAINAATAAYAVVDGAMLTSDAALIGIDLDAATGPSTLDGVGAFMAELATASSLADAAQARGYAGRLVSNLTLFGG